MRKDMMKHPEVCPLLEVACDYCKNMVVRKAMQDHHAGACEEFPVPCPNRCDETSSFRESSVVRSSFCVC